MDYFCGFAVSRIRLPAIFFYLLLFIPGMEIGSRIAMVGRIIEGGKVIGGVRNLTFFCSLYFGSSKFNHLMVCLKAVELLITPMIFTKR